MLLSPSRRPDGRSRVERHHQVEVFHQAGGVEHFDCDELRTEVNAKDEAARRGQATRRQMAKPSGEGGSWRHWKRWRMPRSIRPTRPRRPFDASVDLTQGDKHAWNAERRDGRHFPPRPGSELGPRGCRHPTGDRWWIGGRDRRPAGRRPRDAARAPTKRASACRRGGCDDGRKPRGDQITLCPQGRTGQRGRRGPRSVPESLADRRGPAARLRREEFGGPEAEGDRPPQNPEPPVRPGPRPSTRSRDDPQPRGRGRARGPRRSSQEDRANRATRDRGPLHPSRPVPRGRARDDGRPPARSGRESSAGGDKVPRGMPRRAAPGPAAASSSAMAASMSPVARKWPRRAGRAIPCGRSGR